MRVFDAHHDQPFLVPSPTFSCVKNARRFLISKVHGEGRAPDITVRKSARFEELKHMPSNLQASTNSSRLPRQARRWRRTHRRPSHRVVSARTAARLETCVPCPHLTKVRHLPRLRLLARGFARCQAQGGTCCSFASINEGRSAVCR